MAIDTLTAAIHHGNDTVVIARSPEQLGQTLALTCGHAGAPSPSWGDLSEQTKRGLAVGRALCPSQHQRTKHEPQTHNSSLTFPTG